MWSVGSGSTALFGAEDSRSGGAGDCASGSFALDDKGFGGATERAAFLLWQRSVWPGGFCWHCTCRAARRQQWSIGAESFANAEAAAWLRSDHLVLRNQVALATPRAALLAAVVRLMLRASVVASPGLPLALGAIHLVLRA